MTMEMWASITEIAAELHVSRKTVEKLIAEGRIAVRVLPGMTKRYASREDAQRLLAESPPITLPRPEAVTVR